MGHPTQASEGRRRFRASRVCGAQCRSSGRPGCCCCAPQVYTLWALPHLLPTLPTWSEVSPKVSILSLGHLGRASNGGRL